MAPTTVNRRRTTALLVALATAGAALGLVAAGPTAVPRAGSCPAPATSSDPTVQVPPRDGEVLDLREDRRQTMYLRLHEHGVSRDDVHGSWTSTTPTNEGLAGMSPLDGQTRAAAAAVPVVIEGTWIGPLHDFTLDLFVQTPQDPDVPVELDLQVAVSVDATEVFRGDVASVRRSGAFDCHELHYGRHSLGFHGLSDAMAEAGMGLVDDLHTLRLEFAPRAGSDLPLATFVFDTHYTPAAVHANRRNRGVPMHAID